MKNRSTVALIMILMSIACSKAPDSNKSNVPSGTNSIQNDFKEWWTYHNNNITLSGNFIPIDESSNIIKKGDFLKKLTSGKYIPIKTASNDSSDHYKLYKIIATADKSISSTIKSSAITKYKHYRMEKKPFPDFNFKDLSGKVYNKSNTKDKIIILKCWFIACKPCIKEIPELNELVKKYRDHDDVIFLSLATDSSEELNQFLAKKEFSYPVVANQEEFINDSLSTYTYPTHFIIEKGIIRKVVNKYKDLILALGESKLMKPNHYKKPPPPPPSS